MSGVIFVPCFHYFSFHIPMPTTPLHTALSSRLFEHAAQAHAKGDFELRNSLCFWVQMLDTENLTRQTVERYIRGLEKSAKASSLAVAGIFRSALGEIAGA